MVLTRRQRRQQDEELEGAIEKFMAIRAVALGAPPSEEPIPVIDLVAMEEEKKACKWEKEKEDSMNLLLLCLWCKHTGDIDNTGPDGENQGGGGTERATRAQTKKDAKAIRRKRRKELMKEFALRKGGINEEFEKVRASSGAGSSNQN